MDTKTADADLDTPGTTPADRRPPGGLRPGDPRPGQPVPGAAEDRPTTLMNTTDPATGKPVAMSADGPAAETALLAAERSGPAKPLHKVELVRMKVDSETNTIVNNFIADAENAMQQSVDILGFGRSDPPPAPRGGQMPAKVQAAYMPGAGKGVDLYKQQVFSAGARQDSLVDMDAQVDGTSQVVAAEQAQTLLKITHIESDLNAALLTVATKKLKSAEAAAVMDHIAAAVVKVDEVVTAAQDVNTGAAGGGSSGGSGGGGAGAGAGGAAAGAAGGGLGSMLPMLAMLPMALMPMLGQLPELLGQKKDDEDKENEDAPAGQPAPAAAGPPSDPTAAGPPVGAAPTPGENAPQNPGQPNPQNEIPYGPTSPSKQV